MKIVLIILGVTVLVVACFFISALVIMLVWNALAAYFGFKAISFWIAALISIALSIVGGSFKSSSKS